MMMHPQLTVKKGIPYRGAFGYGTVYHVVIWIPHGGSVDEGIVMLSQHLNDHVKTIAPVLMLRCAEPTLKSYAQPNGTLCMEYKIVVRNERASKL